MAAPKDLSSDAVARRCAFIFAAALRFRCRAFLAAFLDTVGLVGVRGRRSPPLPAENPVHQQRQTTRMIRRG